MYRHAIYGSGIVWLLAGGLYGQGVSGKAVFPANPSLADLSKVLVFEEPLVVSGKASPAEIKAMAGAMESYLGSGSLDDLSPFHAYMAKHPKSPWRLSLLVNVGLMHRHNGQLQQALESWEDAWTMGKDLKDPVSVAYAHRALGELVELNAGLGRKERLEQLFKDAESRSLSGLVTEKLAGAKESLSLMRSSPNRAYRCGPLALTQIKAMEDARAFADPRFEGMDSTLMGTTLSMNRERAERSGMKLQMAKRQPGGALVVPAMVHWKAGHFSAVVAEAGEKYLVQDPGLGDTWVSRHTLDTEASGYALIPAGKLPSGWVGVSEQEGQGVWGRGAWGPGRPDDTRPDSHKVAGMPAQIGAGVPSYRFHTNLVSLNVEANLLSYAPSKGPKVEFTVTYNQREYGQPQRFDYCNLGPKWTFTYLACLKDDTTNPNFNVTICNPGGGGLVFRAKGDGTYEPEDLTQAKLVKTSPAAYAIHYLDGRVEHYTLADRAFGLRRIVLTRITGKDGKDVNLTWDMNLRLVGIKDADGKTTTLAYENPKDILKLTKLTDPMGKSARFEYNEAGQLVRLVNQAGQESTFTYGPTPACPGAPADFLNAMKTSNGTTRFAMGEEMRQLNTVRWLEATRPDGKSERLEGGSEYGMVLREDVIPPIPELNAGALAFRYGFRNSFLWGADVKVEDRKDYGKAVNYQWGHGPGGFASGILIAEKAPGENRTFYVHAGEFWGGAHPMARAKSTLAASGPLLPVFEGGRNLVTRKARVNAQGKLELSINEYDQEGRLLSGVPAAPAVKP